MSLTLLAPGSPDQRHAHDVASLSGRLKVAGIPTRVAYLDHHDPTPPQVAEDLVRDGTEATTVVPLMVNPAHQSRLAIPAAVEAMRCAAPGLAIALSDPVGLHPLLLAACGELAKTSGLGIDDRTGIILAAPGSRDPRAVVAVEGLVRRHGTDLVEALGVRSLRAAYLEGGRPMGAVHTLMRRVDGCTSYVVVSAVIAQGLARDRIVAMARLHDLPVAAGTLTDTNALADLVVLRAGSTPAPIPVEPARAAR